MMLESHVTIIITFPNWYSDGYLFPWRKRCLGFISLMFISKTEIHVGALQLTYAQLWRHQMETFSALLAICEGSSPVPGEFPSQRPVARSFDVFFELRLNKRLSKQS